MDYNTIRVLVLDGGGSRGYVSNRFLAKFVQLWGIADTDLWKYFDVIAGTSVGGIQALAYARGIGVETMGDFFLDEAPMVFTVRTALDVASGSNNASLPSNRPSSASKLAILATNDQIYRAVSDSSNYGHARLKTAISSVFGSDTMQSLKTNSLIAAFRFTTNSPLYISNAGYPEFTGQNYLLTDVAMATSAAPIYLPMYTFGGNDYKDGAIFQNNPAESALALGRALKPLAKRACVLSLGCGLGKVGFDEDGEGGLTPLSAVPGEDAIKELIYVTEAAISGNQEAVHKNLQIRSNYSTKEFYYRFQFDLPEDMYTDIDNTDPAFFEYLNDTADQIFNDDIDDISTFLGHLTA